MCLLLLLKTVCNGSNPRFTTLTMSMLTITPQIWLWICYESIYNFFKFNLIYVYVKLFRIKCLWYIYLSRCFCVFLDFFYRYNVVFNFCCNSDNPLESSCYLLKYSKCIQYITQILDINTS
jgi:hypothetical protein